MNTINQTEIAEKTDYYNTNNTCDNNANGNQNRNSNSTVNELFLPYLQNYNIGLIRGSENNRESLNKITRMNNNININTGKVNK